MTRLVRLTHLERGRQRFLMWTFMADLSEPVPKPLGLADCGFRGSIKSIHVSGAASGMAAEEVELRLLELGFVEGAAVEVLHQGPVGRDPLAVRVNGATIALRRREAMAIQVI